ncbi:MAG: class I SAM-dependent methyltransferase [Bacillota bacterium]
MFLRQPRQVGSITPSSRFLTTAILKPVDWASTQYIAELGAGTGVFTAAINEHRSPESQFIVFEKDSGMRDQLAQRFPSLLIGEDACLLNQTVHDLGMPKLDVIVSGLPFALFPPSVREHLMDEIISVLQPHGLLIMFQYSLQMKELLLSRFARVETAFVPLNMPPAFVNTCYQQKRHDRKVNQPVYLS